MFRLWVLAEGRVNQVSSVVEHQTKDLAVTGSTPVPTPQAKHLLRCGPREVGQRVIGHWQLATGGAEDSGQSVLRDGFR